LDILLEAVTGDSDGLNFQDVRNEVDTFMFEGHDTTGSGLIWSIYNIAKNPDIEARVIEEVDRVLGDRLHPDWDDMKSFPYLSMVLKETLRLYPPVPFISRNLPEELTVHGYRLPAQVRWLMLPQSPPTPTHTTIIIAKSSISH
jgi:cytochrome P450